MRDPPELGDGGRDLGDGLVEQAIDVDRAVIEVALGQSDRHAERDEPLLGAVVQIPFESSRS